MLKSLDKDHGTIIYNTTPQFSEENSELFSEYKTQLIRVHSKT